MTRPSVLRMLIALGSIASGLLHLRLYFSAYRDIPIENLGRSFLLSAVAALAAAALVVTIRYWSTLVLPLLLADATLIAFGLSRIDRGIFGFTENGWTPSPDAAASVAIEIGTALLCLVALVSERRRRRRQ